jgi:Protein of unknown function (DUF4197)
MKKFISLFLLFYLFGALPCFGGVFDGLFGSYKFFPKGGHSDPTTTGAGLRDALAVSAQNAVSLLSQNNGYYTNEAVKIIVPEKIRNVAETLKKSGHEQKVDDFVLSMNRAAEKASPQAKGIFFDAIMGMTLDDAQGLLEEGNTAATDYLKSKAYQEIYDEYKPIVSSKLDEEGGTAKYLDMMKTFASPTLIPAQSLDLDDYVTNQAIAGLFRIVGQEEIKIRTDPDARVTALLEDIFGK